MFTKGIKAKLNELESESDKMKGEVDSLVNFPIATSLKTIAHSALFHNSMKNSKLWNQAKLIWKDHIDL